MLRESVRAESQCLLTFGAGLLQVCIIGFASGLYQVWIEFAAGLLRVCIRFASCLYGVELCLLWVCFGFASDFLRVCFGLDPGLDVKWPSVAPGGATLATLRVSFGFASGLPTRVSLP